MLDALVFGVCAIVILPLLPNRAVGPFAILNPFTLWRLVVVVMGITGGGYVAQRLLGGRFGLALAGLASGFVSSVATINAMGARAKADPAEVRPAVAGATGSTVATFVQLTILLGAASPRLLRHVAIPLACGGGSALFYAAIQTWRAARVQREPVPPGRAFDLRSAVVFATLVSVIMLVSTLIVRWLGQSGALIAATVAGFADAHATASSMASLYAVQQLEERAATLGVALAVTSNSVTKIVIALSSGPRPYAWRVVLGVAIVLACTWAGFLIVLWPA